MAGSEEEQEQVEQLGKDAERETRSLEKDADELGERIDETRKDWLRKRREETASGEPLTEDDEAEGSGGETADEAAG